MCTVVFIPNNNQITLASIRDENPKRKNAMAPKVYSNNDCNVIYPLDPQGNGTWIGANDYGNAIVLLNGAFDNHIRKDSYVKSRGLIVKELLHTRNPIQIWETMNLIDIEPFTLIVYSNEKLYHLVWDGNQKHTIAKDINQAHIWSSATLYNQATTQYRKLLFENWIATKPQISNTSIADFFNTYIDKNNGFIMHRTEILKSLSLSIIQFSNENNISFEYMDIEAKASTMQHLAIKNELISI